jgi:hypothetical protein
VIAVLPSWFRRHHPGRHLSTSQLLAYFILRGLTDRSVSHPRSMHAHARSADALQFLRSHAPQPAHDYSMTAFAQVCAAACLCHVVRLTAHYLFPASLVNSPARSRMRRRPTSLACFHSPRCPFLSTQSMPRGRPSFFLLFGPCRLGVVPTAPKHNTVINLGAPQSREQNTV